MVSDRQLLVRVMSWLNHTLRRDPSLLRGYGTEDIVVRVYVPGEGVPMLGDLLICAHKRVKEMQPGWTVIKDQPAFDDLATVWYRTCTRESMDNNDWDWFVRVESDSGETET